MKSLNDKVEIVFDSASRLTAEVFDRDNIDIIIVAVTGNNNFASLEIELPLDRPIILCGTKENGFGFNFMPIKSSIPGKT